MDIAGLVRVVQALLTAVLLLIAAGGVVLAWAVGDLPALNIALLACAIVAPAVHRACWR
jgi:hypothetical protein